MPKSVFPEPPESLLKNDANSTISPHIRCPGSPGFGNAQGTPSFVTGAPIPKPVAPSSVAAPTTKESSLGVSTYNLVAEKDDVFGIGELPKVASICTDGTCAPPAMTWPQKLMDAGPSLTIGFLEPAINEMSKKEKKFRALYERLVGNPQSPPATDTVELPNEYRHPMKEELPSEANHEMIRCSGSGGFDNAQGTPSLVADASNEKPVTPSSVAAPITKQSSFGVSTNTSAPRGVARIIEALNKCGGIATLAELHKSYAALFGRPFDQTERKTHFGTCKMNRIQKEISNKILAYIDATGVWRFVSKERLEKTKELGDKQNEEAEKEECERIALQNEYAKARRGVSRIMQALSKFSGMVSLAELNKSYKLLFGCEWNKMERGTHFGSHKLQTIIDKWLDAEVKVTRNEAGIWIFEKKVVVESHEERGEERKDATGKEAHELITGQKSLAPPPSVITSKALNEYTKVTQRVNKEPLPATRNERARRGVSRVVEALVKCGGMASLEELNKAYEALFGCPFDQVERIAHFGSDKFKTIYPLLSHEISLTNNNGKLLFEKKACLQTQEEWEETRVSVTHDGRKVWKKPTIKELFDRMIAILVSIHPKPLSVSSMSDAYKRVHGVEVNPELLYGKSWDELVKTTFREKMRMTQGEVLLTPRAFQEFQQTALDRQKTVVASFPSKEVKQGAVAKEISPVTSREQTGCVLLRVPAKLMSAAEFDAVMRIRRKFNEELTSRASSASLNVATVWTPENSNKDSRESPIKASLLNSSPEKSPPPVSGKEQRRVSLASPAPMADVIRNRGGFGFGSRGRTSGFGCFATPPSKPTSAASTAAVKNAAFVHPTNSSVAPTPVPKPLPTVTAASIHSSPSGFTHTFARPSGRRLLTPAAIRESIGAHHPDSSIVNVSGTAIS